MAQMAWQDSIDVLSPHVAKISTPRWHGTGFLFSHTPDKSICALATAAHVVEEAQLWEEPIRIEQQHSGKSLFLHAPERAILRRSEHDTAAIIFRAASGMFPNRPLKLMHKKKGCAIGMEVGWLGFPGIAPDNLCFFSGRVSSRLEEQRSYLVDGVAINGVSGGPAFYLQEDGTILLIGIVSAYRPNVSPAGTLPGLCVIRHVGELHGFVKQLKSLRDAKKGEEANPPASTQAYSEKANPPSDGA